MSSHTPHLVSGTGPWNRIIKSEGSFSSVMPKNCTVNFLFALSHHKGQRGWWTENFAWVVSVFFWAEEQLNQFHFIYLSTLPLGPLPNLQYLEILSSWWCLPICYHTLVEFGIFCYLVNWLTSLVVGFFVCLFFFFFFFFKIKAY